MTKFKINDIVIFENFDGNHKGIVSNIKKIEHSGQRYCFYFVSPPKNNNQNLYQGTWVSERKITEITNAGDISGFNVSSPIYNHYFKDDDDEAKIPGAKKDKNKKEEKKILKEYRKIFEENEEMTDDNNYYSFVKSISRNIVASDKEIFNALKNIEKSETEVLQKAFKELKKYIKNLISIKIIEEAKLSKEKGELVVQFFIELQNKKKDKYGPFIIKSDNKGIPQIIIPDAAKTQLQNLPGKLKNTIIASLVVFNDSELTKMKDTVNNIKNLNIIGKKKELIMDKFLSDLNALQLSILKRLLKQKYTGGKYR